LSTLLPSKSDNAKKGTSSVMTFIAYFFIAQIVAFAAAFGYYKFRVQQNDKKFM